MPPSIQTEWFNALLAPIRPALVRYAASRCGWQEAENRVQEASYSAWFARERFDRTGSPNDLFVFIFPFLRDSCHAFNRTRGREYCFSLDSIEEMGENIGEVPDIAGDIFLDLREELRTLLDRTTLTGRQEACLRLWLDGFSQSVIATHFQITQQAVSQHIAAACEHLARVRGVSVSVWALQLFTYMATVVIYHKPIGVRDRRGNAAQVQKRRYVLLEDEENIGAWEEYVRD